MWSVSPVSHDHGASGRPGHCSAAVNEHEKPLLSCVTLSALVNGQQSVACETAKCVLLCPLLGQNTATPRRTQGVWQQSTWPLGEESGLSYLVRDAGVLTRQTLAMDGRAGSWSDAEARLRRGEEGRRVWGGGAGHGPGSRGGEERCREASQAGEGKGGPRASEAALDERVAEQPVCSGPPLLLHEHLPQEVPGRVRRALWKNGLRRLGGDLKNGCHGLVLGPRRLLGQHFHNSAGDAPEGKQHPAEAVDRQNILSDHIKYYFTCSLMGCF